MLLVAFFVLVAGIIGCLRCALRQGDGDTVRAKVFERWLKLTLAGFGLTMVAAAIEAARQFIAFALWVHSA